MIVVLEPPFPMTTGVLMHIAIGIGLLSTQRLNNAPVMQLADTSM